jgi:hypothetical protein
MTGIGRGYLNMYEIPQGTPLRNTPGHPLETGGLTYLLSHPTCLKKVSYYLLLYYIIRILLLLLLLLLKVII